MSYDYALIYPFPFSTNWHTTGPHDGTARIGRMMKLYHREMFPADRRMSMFLARRKERAVDLEQSSFFRVGLGPCESWKGTSTRGTGI